MKEAITLEIDGRPVRVRAGTTVAAAILNAGHLVLRISPSGARRAPLCGMGICFECRVRIDDRPGRRSCQVLCREGMRVRTGDAD